MLFRALSSNANAPPALRFKVGKKKWLALTLMLILAGSGTTYAWSVSRGIVQGGSVAMERVKVAVFGLSSRVDGEWVSLSFGPALLTADMAREAFEAKERLVQAKESLDPEAWYQGTSYTLEEDQETALGAQAKFSITNQGDEAFVFVKLENALDIELATSAFLGEDYVWFEDVVFESADVLQIEFKGSIVVDLTQANTALLALGGLLKSAEDDLSGNLYQSKLQAYEEALMQALANPEDDSAIQAVQSAHEALSDSVSSGEQAQYIELLENRDLIAKKRSNMEKLVEALTRAESVAKSSVCIKDGYLVALDSEEKTRPLTLSEIEELADAPIALTASLRYGDLLTQLMATPIRQAFVREDNRAFIISMASDSVVDVVLEVEYPQIQGIDNTLNGARLWLGRNISASAASNSTQALKDLYGIESGSGFSQNLAGKTLAFNPAELTPALGFKE
jgi:hypothetical protein